MSPKHPKIPKSPRNTVTPEPTPESVQYHQDLREVQIELVKFQKHLIRENQKVLIIFEGRDAAGKDGTIKDFTEHLSAR